MFSYTLFSQTIYVDQNATGSNNGTDWANAYTNLQTAITNIGTNTTINVAQGTYFTTTTTNRDIYFTIPNGVKMYGGFQTGGGTKNPDIYHTILSGDIGVIGDNTDNSYHIVYFLNTISSTEIDGFIIENGYANGSGTNESNGGGILISTVDVGDSNAYIRNCTIRNNYAVSTGGGIFVSKRAEIYNCNIYSNQTGDSGGGIYISTNGRIYNSYIVNNKSVYFGGGIRITGINTAPKAINCVIANNECEYYGAGAHLAEGYLNNCTIVNNGGNGVHFGSYGSTFNGIIWGNSTYQSTHLASGSGHLVENNCIQDIATTGTNIGISSTNNGVVFGENYPRFTNPTTFTGNATTPAQLDEILNANWYINPESAAIDFGDNSSYPTTTDTPIVDIIGNSRTINIKMDAGAYEALTNVTTNIATNQQPTSATLNGEVIFAETTNTITRGFVYAITPNFDVTTATSVTNAAIGLGVYSENITGLTQDQLYYYRAWVQFDGVTYYGSEKQFKASNLVAYYPFNGNANDESGSENNGTVHGATLTTDKSENTNSAYNFNGTDNYIQCLFPGPLEAASRTISFWAKTDVAPTNDYGNDVLSYGISASSGDYGARFDIELNSKGYGLGCGLGGGEITKSFDNSDFEWHFYTVVVDNSIGINLTDVLFYADGNLLTTNSAYNNSNPVIHTKDEYPIHIGMLYDYGRYFKGDIDEIKIYNRALTPVEILSLYTNNTLKVEKIENVASSNFYVNNNILCFKDIQNLTEINKVEVYNVLGQKVFKTSEITEQIPLNMLQKDIYILKVKNTNGNYYTLKFIIN